MPTDRAHGIQIMKTCEALAAQNVGVELLVPTLTTSINEDPFEYYGVKKNFEVMKLFSIGLVRFGRIGFVLQSFLFSVSSLVYILINTSDDDIFYGRDEFVIWFLSLFRKNIFWETHNATDNYFSKKVLKKAKGVVSITNGLKNYYIEYKLADENNFLIVPDAVDLEDFNVDLSKNECRKKIGLDEKGKYVMYIGLLDDWKGYRTLLSISTELKKGGIQTVIVGGEENQIIKLRHEYPDSIFMGYTPYKILPIVQSAADVLVIPNSAKYKISSEYTSPLKLFAHMASGRPIIASDLQSIREILNDNNSLLVEPDNPKELELGILKIINDEELAGKISKKAYNCASKYSWKNRATKIIDFIKNKTRHK